MTNDYSIMAQFYRELVMQRDHFKKQLELLGILCDFFGIGLEAKILDAACGTGDVIIELSKTYSNLFAVDGSKHQIEQWSDSPCSIVRECCNWDDLDTFVNAHGSFDMIYFLGHSLPHLDSSKLHKMLRTLYTGLNSNGVLVFDIRQWSRRPDGGFEQAGRESGIMHLVGRVTSNGRSYLVSETVSYGGDRQGIEYRFLPSDDRDRPMVEVLSYHMYEWRDAVQWLQGAGFERSDIYVFKIVDWPYLVIAARKQR